jgi:DNA-binding CsgD family transcriptional regulator
MRISASSAERSSKSSRLAPEATPARSRLVRCGNSTSEPARAAQTGRSATGEAVRKRTLDTRHVLTAQEAQISHLARYGLSNPEIGARLFISPRTVQYHLGKVFAKLEVTSRNQLGRVPASRLSPV